MPFNGHYRSENPPANQFLQGGSMQRLEVTPTVAQQNVTLPPSLRRREQSTPSHAGDEEGHSQYRQLFSEESSEQSAGPGWQILDDYLKVMGH